MKLPHFHFNRRFFFRLLKVLGLLFVFLLISASVFALSTRTRNYCVSDDVIEKKFLDKGILYSENHYNQGQNRAYFLSVGDVKTKPMVLFIHDALGSSADFLNFLSDSDLAGKAYLVALDRAGHCRTTGPSAFTLKDQMDMLAPILSLSKGKVIVVGDSYGASLAVDLAIGRPDKVENLILLTPSVDPSTLRHQYWQRLQVFISRVPLLSKLFAPTYLESLQEFRSLPEELQALGPSLRKIEAPVTIFGGTNASDKNSLYMSALCKATTVTNVKLPAKFDQEKDFGLLQKTIEDILSTENLKNTH